MALVWQPCLMQAMFRVTFTAPSEEVQLTVGEAEVGRLG